MFESTYIQIKVDSLSRYFEPSDVELEEIKSFLSDIHTLLQPIREDKRGRPLVCCSVRERSMLVKVNLPEREVALFDKLLAEVRSNESLNSLRRSCRAVLCRMQDNAANQALSFTLSSALNANVVVIDQSTSYGTVKPEFLEGEFYLYGDMLSEESGEPTIQIQTDKHGNLTVKASEAQLNYAKRKKNFKPYGILVKGKKSLGDESLYDLELIEFVAYKPDFSDEDIPQPDINSPGYRMRQKRDN